MISLCVQYFSYTVYMFQVIQSEGLGRWVNVEALKREIVEAGDMTQEQLDLAAFHLMRDRKSGTLQGPYYEHLGGIRAHEMKDYHQYSAQDDLRHRQGYSEDLDPRDNSKMVYVTTL